MEKNKDDNGKIVEDKKVRSNLFSLYTPGLLILLLLLSIFVIYMGKVNALNVNSPFDMLSFYFMFVLVAVSVLIVAYSISKIIGKIKKTQTTGESRNGDILNDKITNKIICFYPFGLSILLILQIIIGVYILGNGKFPIPYVTEWSTNSFVSFLMSAYMILAFFGSFPIIIIYTIHKIVKIIKSKENRITHIKDLAIFATGFITHFLFFVILNKLTNYIDWLFD